MRNLYFVANTKSIGDLNILEGSILKQGSILSKSSNINGVKYDDNFGLDRDLTVSQGSFLKRESIICYGSSLSIPEPFLKNLDVNSYLDMTDVTDNNFVFSDLVNKFALISEEKSKLTSMLEMIKLKLEESISDFNSVKEQYQQRIQTLQERNMELIVSNETVGSEKEKLIEEEKQLIEEAKLFKESIQQKQQDLENMEQKLKSLDKSLEVLNESKRGSALEISKIKGVFKKLYDSSEPEIEPLKDGLLSVLERVEADIQNSEKTILSLSDGNESIKQYFENSETEKKIMSAIISKLMSDKELLLRDKEADSQETKRILTDMMSEIFRVNRDAHLLRQDLETQEEESKSKDHAIVGLTHDLDVVLESKAKIESDYLELKQLNLKFQKQYDEDINMYSQIISTLKEQHSEDIEILRSDYESMSARCIKLASLLEQKEMNVEDLRNQISNLIDLHKEKEETIDKMSFLHSLSEKENLSIKEEHRLLSLNVDSLQAQIQDLTNHNDDIEYTNQKLKTENQELQESIDRLQAQIQGLNNQKADIECSNQILKSGNQELHETVDRLEIQVQHLKDELHALNLIRISEEKEIMEHEKSHVEKLLKKCIELKTENNDLTVKMTSLANNISNHEDIVSSVDGSSLTDKIMSLLETKNKYIELKKSHDELTHVLRETLSSNKNLESQLQEVSGASSELIDVKADLESMSTLLEEAKASLALSQSYLDSKESEHKMVVDSLTEELVSQNNALTELTVKYNNVLSEQNEHKMVVDSLTEELVSQNNAFTELTVKYNDVLSQLKEHKMVVDSLTEELVSQNNALTELTVKYNDVLSQLKDLQDDDNSSVVSHSSSSCSSPASKSGKLISVLRSKLIKYLEQKRILKEKIRLLTRENETLRSERDELQNEFDSFVKDIGSDVACHDDASLSSHESDHSHHSQHSQCNKEREEEKEEREEHFNEENFRLKKDLEAKDLKIRSISDDLLTVSRAYAELKDNFDDLMSKYRLCDAKDTDYHKYKHDCDQLYSKLQNYNFETKLKVKIEELLKAENNISKLYASFIKKQITDVQFLQRGRPIKEARDILKKECYDMLHHLTTLIQM